MELPVHNSPLQSGNLANADSTNEPDPDVGLVFDRSPAGIERARKLQNFTKHAYCGWSSGINEIDPEDLREARERLREVPVYYVNRFVTRSRPHGYIGLGNPGEKHASTITVTGGYRRKSIDLDAGFLKTVMSRKHSFLGIQFGGYRFKEEIRNTVTQLSKQLEHGNTRYICLEDFFRAYHEVRIQNREECSQLTEEMIHAELNALFRIVPPEGHSEIWPTGLSFEMSLRQFNNVDWNEYPKYVKNNFQNLLGKDISELSETQKSQLEWLRSQIGERSIDRMASSFLKDDWDGFRSDNGISAKKVEGLSGIDVVEANRQALLTRLFVDEKLRRSGSMLPLELQGTCTAELMPELDDVDKYESVTGKNKLMSKEEKNKHGLSRRELSKRIPTYCRLLKTKTFREPGVGFFTSLYAKLFRSDDSTGLASRGNCYTGSGSLLRLAAKLKGTTLSLKATAYVGHGVSHDISDFWMPTTTRAKQEKRIR